MGFAYNTAITTDAEIFEIAFEQEIVNLLRQSGETDLQDIAKRAVNYLILQLKRKGVDHTLVSNTSDFKFELIYWICKMIYHGEEPDALGRRMKFDSYDGLYKEAVEQRVIELTDGTTVLGSDAPAALPAVGNQDTGAYFPGVDNKRSERSFTAVPITNIKENLHSNPS